MTINDGGLFDLNGYATYMGALSGSSASTLALGSGYLYADWGYTGTSTFGGLITGSGTLDKQSTATLILTKNNTYTGLTKVTTGTLLVNGSQPQSPVTVDAGATFGGIGTVGTITASGTVAPGASAGSPGILTCSNLTFTSGATYAVDIFGPNLATGYDQLNVRGTNNLANANLSRNFTYVTPLAQGQKFTIINNDGTDAITGAFAGLAEGASITINAYHFTISYVGGTGNDVVLTLVDGPTAAVSSSVTSGNGNHAIDPNECNQLSLVISNNTGGVMGGLNGTLSTTTPGVLITQPYSAYPNLGLNGQGVNLTPFQISTLPGFTCGTDINLQLTVTSSWPPFTMNIVQHTGEPVAIPMRYDNNTATTIPDVGSVDSTITVGSFSSPLAKVTASIYLTHTYDADLTISLISPDGTTVVLSSGNGGSGLNYGSGSADASRTWFDDAASTAITSGVAPFVGTFRPQQPLSAFIGKPAAAVNGTWRLRIADANGGSLGTLRNWTLVPYWNTCGTGGGACDYCLTSITNSIDNTDPTQVSSLVRTFGVASCGSPKFAPAAYNGATALHYDIYAFTNTSASAACVTMLLSSGCDVQAVMYLNAFDPANITDNYLADSGASTADGAARPQSCSGSIPAGAKFYVTVNEVTPNAGCSNYTLQLSGLPCPPPTLAITPAISAGNVRLHWPTWAGEYSLETSSTVKPGAWATCTNEPIISNGRCNVTNDCVAAPELFYRLHKP